ncbi:MAG: hypothetical protein SNJ59_17305, partial [Aggregatilineales bacterium]
ALSWLQSAHGWASLNPRALDSIALQNGWHGEVRPLPNVLYRFRGLWRGHIWTLDLHLRIGFLRPRARRAEAYFLWTGRGGALPPGEQIVILYASDRPASLPLRGGIAGSYYDFTFRRRIGYLMSRGFVNARPARPLRAIIEMTDLLERSAVVYATSPGAARRFFSARAVSLVRHGRATDERLWGLLVIFITAHDLQIFAQLPVRGATLLDRLRGRPSLKSSDLVPLLLRHMIELGTALESLILEQAVYTNAHAESAPPDLRPDGAWDELIFGRRAGL